MQIGLSLGNDNKVGIFMNGDTGDLHETLTLDKEEAKELANAILKFLSEK